MSQYVKPYTPSCDLTSCNNGKKGRKKTPDKIVKKLGRLGEE